MDDNVDKGKEYDILFDSSNKHLFCKNNLFDYHHGTKMPCMNYTIFTIKSNLIKLVDLKYSITRNILSTVAKNLS